MGQCKSRCFCFKSIDLLGRSLNSPQIYFSYNELLKQIVKLRLKDTTAIKYVFINALFVFVKFRRYRYSRKGLGKKG